jgi:hypothetical protein
MAKTQQVDRSRQLPDYVQVNGSKTMPDGMTNFIQRLMKTQHGRYVLKTTVGEPKRTASADGPFGFVLNRFSATENSIKLTLNCGGFSRKTTIICYAPNFCWDLLVHLRQDPCLKRDDSLRSTRCTRCGDQLTELAPRDVWVDDQRVIKENEPICAPCVNEARTPTPSTDADEAFLDELERSVADHHRATSQGFLDELRPEVVAAADREATKGRKPWWRRRRR